MREKRDKCTKPTKHWHNLWDGGHAHQIATSKWNENQKATGQPPINAQGFGPAAGSLAMFFPSPFPIWLAFHLVLG